MDSNQMPRITDDEEEFVVSGSSECSDNLSESQAEIDESVIEEMTKLEDALNIMGLKFRMIDRIGEGTFSTVYKAEDLDYDFYQNDWDDTSNGASKWSPPTIKRRMKDSKRSLSPHNLQLVNKDPHYVAIKKIYVTSSPMRIQNELELLHDLRGCGSVCPLITAFRHQDQVVAVLPYFRHQDFRMFYRQMKPNHIRTYFRSLFEGLASVHKHGIIHRDIKPTNFLYDIERRRGVLVDFGLAEREGTESSYCLCQDNTANRREKIESSKAANQLPPNGYPKNDQRPSKRANRAGTRGFRAPEVLLKCTAQTTKIDIWSAGVILLTILTQRFPFFNSTDDVEAMIEIGAIFGQKRMKTCSILHGAVFESTIPSIGEKGYNLEHLVQWSTCSIRPEQGDVLSPKIKKIIGFLELLLELDPRRRVSARAALATEFLTEDPDPESEDDGMDILEQP